MIKPEIRERLDNSALVFDNPAYDGAIIGETFDGRAIYDIEKWQMNWRRMTIFQSKRLWTLLIIMR